MPRPFRPSREVARLETSSLVEGGLERVVRAGAAGARRRAPVDTGELRDGIDYEVEPGRGRFGTDVEHGLYQEVGTFKMQAQPWLRPALDDARVEVRRA